MDAGTQAAAGSELPKRVSWIELFFDLVFVFAVTEVAVVLAVLNLHELRSDGRSGWRARPAARRAPD